MTAANDRDLTLIVTRDPSCAVAVTANMPLTAKINKNVRVVYLIVLYLPNVPLAPGLTPRHGYGRSDALIGFLDTWTGRRARSLFPVTTAYVAW